MKQFEFEKMFNLILVVFVVLVFFLVVTTFNKPELTGDVYTTVGFGLLLLAILSLLVKFTKEI